MKIEHIRTFLEISDCGNFNRAADNLNVAQSTVSARVKSMEESFGRELFRRNHAGVELTSAGQHFRQYALNIQRLWQQAHQRITLPENFDHALGLGSQVSLWDSLILKWIPWMRRNAAAIALHVEADYSPSLMRQLADGLLDIGVMYQPRQTPGLIIEDLFEETLILVATDRDESQSVTVTVVGFTNGSPTSGVTVTSTVVLAGITPSTLLGPNDASPLLSVVFESTTPHQYFTVILAPSTPTSLHLTVTLAVSL